MVQSWIIESFAVGDQCAEDRADLEQLLPIAIVACQAGGIIAEYQANAGQTNLCEKPLKATACLSLCS